TFVAPISTYYVAASETLLISAGTHTFDPSTPTAPLVRFQAFDYATAAAHMRFLGGTPPPDVTRGVPQAAITHEMAMDDDLDVGSTLVVTQFGNHDVHLAATVSGIWAPDEGDAYWNGINFSAHGSDNAPSVYPVQLTFDGLFAGLAAFKNLGMSQHW